MIRLRVTVMVVCLPAAGCSWFEDVFSSSGTGTAPNVQVEAFPVETRDVQWRGWSAIEQTNGLMTLRHVPDAGGRTMSLEINGHDLFMVFPVEAGKTYPADSRDNAVHFGGHYACIGPERIWNVHEQPFNPHGGPHRVVRQTGREDRHKLHFISRPDTWLGATISMERKITVHQGNTHVVIDEKVINRGPDPLECYLWDFTQIDAVDHRKPDRELRRLSVYVPVPRKDGKKEYTTFLDPKPAMQAQFDESLTAEVLAIHYAAEQFKIASDAEDWWVAAVDHDTGWTYVKAFDRTEGDRPVTVDNNGPIEVYGANRDEPLGGSFVELELLAGMGRYRSGESIEQREHWYATTCKGPVLELTPVGVVCDRLTCQRDGEYYDVSGRFGVFYLGVARLRLEDRKGKTLFVGEPILIDPRKEFTLTATAPAKKDAAAAVLEVFDYQAKLAGELARTDLR